MRIFICTPTATLQGGVERILESLATHLPSRGFEVVFGLSKGARFHDPQRFRAAFPVIRGVDVDGTSGTAYGRRRALRRAIVEADPDVVLIARIFDAYPAASELKLEGHRLRLVVTIQANEPEYFADLAVWRDFVDCCVTSGELAASAARRELPDERVRSIPGGVAPPLRHVTHDPAAPLRLGYVGRLEQLQKRILDLPLLVAELHRRGVPFTMTIAGGGSMEAQLGLPVRGWLSTAELYERVYPELDVLVHFAEWEGITIAPREAMAHGAVPVVSRFRGLEEEGQLVDGVNALTFPVGDVMAAADRIERLHRDRALLARLSAAARASQGGIRSEQGSTDAWAEAFRTALSLPQRVGTMPALRGDSGLLTRLGVPPALAELVRKVRRREHADAGSEWPHWGGM
ncbi:MAG TPA: glycosyltransferase family 4 protein [Thermoanaerobaculia bacterium]|jgi:glycosyltransferase involved in cell wall biosynthesis